METTALYAEMIIIGLETSIWIALFSSTVFGNKTWELFKYILEELPAAIFLLGIFYVVGLIMDRIADIMFSNFEKKCRQASGLVASTSMIVWKQSNQENYFLYTRSRIRIIRASTINIPLIVLAFLFVFPNISHLQQVYVVVVGFLFIFFSIVGYRHSVKSFYEKAALLEQAHP